MEVDDRAAPGPGGAEHPSPQPDSLSALDLNVLGSGWPRSRQPTSKRVKQPAGPPGRRHAGDGKAQESKGPRRPSIHLSQHYAVAGLRVREAADSFSPVT